MTTQNTRHLSNNFFGGFCCCCGVFWLFFLKTSPPSLAFHFTVNYHEKLEDYPSKSLITNQTPKAPHLICLTAQLEILPCSPLMCIYTELHIFEMLCICSLQFTDCHQRTLWPAEKLCKRSISPKSGFKTSRNSSQNQHDNSNSLRKL